MARTEQLTRALCAIAGVRRVFDGPGFHEVVLPLDRPVAPVLEALGRVASRADSICRRVLPGARDRALLVCATETKTARTSSAMRARWPKCCAPARAA